jgi:hypothetical protein
MEDPGLMPPTPMRFHREVPPEEEVPAADELSSTEAEAAARQPEPTPAHGVSEQMRVLGLDLFEVIYPNK